MLLLIFYLLTTAFAQTCGQEKIPLLSLVMIVKNEAPSIAQTIASVRGVVDRYTVLDTGSTDDTIKIIREAFGTTPGDIYEESFVDFATTRNRAIELEGTKSKFMLMLSGDETLHNASALRTTIEKGDAWNLLVHYGKKSQFTSTRIHRSATQWRYKGVTHEYMTGPDGQTNEQRIKGPYIYYNTTSVTRESKRERWELDIQLLVNEWTEVAATPRTAFYLAQSYDSLEKFEDAMNWYRTRSVMGGWEEGKYESIYRMGRISQHLNESWDISMKHYMHAYSVAPHRAEPLYQIGSHYQAQQQYALAFIYMHQAWRKSFPEDANGFTYIDIYNELIPNALLNIAHHVGEIDIGRQILQTLYPDIHDQYTKYYK